MKEDDDLLPDRTLAKCPQCGTEASYLFSEDQVACSRCGTLIDIATIRAELQDVFERLAAILESEDAEAIKTTEGIVAEVRDAVQNGRPLEVGFYEKHTWGLFARYARRASTTS